MTMWFIILLVIIALTMLALFYAAYGVRCFFRPHFSEKTAFAASLLSVFMPFVIFGLCLRFINAAIILWHFAVFLLVCSLFRSAVSALFGKKLPEKTVPVLGFILSFAVLCGGWYADHHVWRTEYNIVTSKIVKPVKFVMFADSHIGTTFDADGFAGLVKEMNAERPDAVFIAGDFVDDDTSREDMIASCRALAEFKTSMGVYFVAGNHDKGYYGAARRGFSMSELTEELKKNGVTVLSDESVDLGERLTVFGRKDLSVVRERHASRKAPSEFMASVAPENYTIVLDHQPAEYDLLAGAGSDLVLSGHTHGGQLFPFNQVGKIIGAVDAVSGREHRMASDFIVTSGLSDWAIKFKTGTRSEYVVISLRGSDSGDR
ncbi:MAG: metallophosphoesterase [Ruminobacter sp.]|uniref:metallophosphoesterase n=1 Tax=Ruminobacter sp. TaxID=2774296 RepID=UPI001B4FF3AF|nr:metallophosphoesterase [Ruminobacter sp.]MBP3748014.1 metallophosphoesterase [Ruminobacter sp.]